MSEMKSTNPAGGTERVSAFFLDYERDGDTVTVTACLPDGREVVTGMLADDFETFVAAMGRGEPVDVLSPLGGVLHVFPLTLTVRLPQIEEMLDGIRDTLRSNPGVLAGLISGEIEYRLTADGAEMVYPDLEE